MTIRVIALTVSMVFTAVFIAACGDASTGNANANRSNAVTNLGANNANTGAVVVNANSNAGANTNRWNPNITRDEYERNRGEYERDRGDSRIGTGANDMWLWVKTRASLLGAEDLRDSTINVDVENDVVTLRGTVASAAQKSRAEQVAKGIEGVKSVRNQLTVSADGDNANNRGNTGGNANANANRR